MIGWRWIAAAAIAGAFIAAPFLLFERSMLDWTADLLRSDRHAAFAACAVVVLLASDVLLPIPSSLVSTAAGATLGFVPGLLASTLGMSLGCQIGYALGKAWGLPLVRRIVGERELEVVAAQFRERGSWTIAILRPVPVLAEASVLFAGVANVNARRFIAATALTNACISAVYCAAGALALQTGSFPIVFAAAIAVSGILMTAGRLLSAPRKK